MQRLLLTVTGCFELRNGFLVLDPEFEAPDSVVQQECQVTLRRPDGTIEAATASITRPFVNRHPYSPPGLVCLLRGVKKGDVPLGTEVWVEQVED